MSIVPASTRPRLCRSKSMKNKPKVYESLHPRSVGGQSGRQNGLTPVRCRAGTLAAKWHPRQMRPLRDGKRISAQASLCRRLGKLCCLSQSTKLGRIQQALIVSCPANDATAAGCPGW